MYKKGKLVLIQFFKQSWLVMAAALVFGLLVAGVHGVLEECIADNATLKLEREMKSLFGQDSVSEAVRDENGETRYYKVKDKANAITGYAIVAEGSGFADKIKLLVATDEKTEKLLGIAVLKTNETPGFGDKIKKEKFRDQFVGCPIKEELLVILRGDRDKADSEIVSITGATISSEAVTDIVNDAVIKLRNK